MLRSSFQQVVLLFPLATLAHVWEEWPGFPRWARRFASPDYSDREYVIVHVVAVSTAAIAAALASRYPSRTLVFLAFTFVFCAAGFWNGLFHASAWIATGSFCPGAITGLVLYVPFVSFLAVLAARDGVLSPLALGIAFALSLAFHVLEVGHSVFKRW